MPVFLDASSETLESFRERLKPTRVVDQYQELLTDLCEIRNPPFKFKKEHAEETAQFIAQYSGGTPLEVLGQWVFFPWNSTLAHYLPEAEHQEIRTARNRNIITKEEQEKLYNICVAYAGLSVGSHGLTTFALMGGAKHIKIADPDTVSPSNLNRIRQDFLAVGRKKTDLALEYIYQLNPYATVEVYDSGVNDSNMEEFFKGADVLVEETDNLEMKIRLRLEARARRIPVIMATDNGDNIIFEAERFDLNPDAQLFNGAIGDITIEEFKTFPPHELPKLATKIAGPGFVTERMMSSLLEVGKTIYSWPQLGDAATLSGVAIAYALKRLALGQQLTESKCEVSLDAIMDPEFSTRHDAREEARTQFLKTIGLDV